MPQLTVLGAIKLVVFIAATAYSIKQQRKIKKAMRNLGNIQGEAQGRLQTRRDSAAYKQVVYGECRVGGTVVLDHNNGADNGVKHLIIEMAGHEVDALSNLMFDDELVPLDSNGHAIGRFAGFVEAYFFNGAQTSIPPANSLAPEVWDNDHKLLGSAGVYVRLKYREDLFPGGIPNITALCRGKKVYDPRSDLTAWSNNAALCLSDFYCDAEYGLAFDYYSEIDEAELIASANVCDELVTLADGVTTEKRYAVNGSYTADTTKDDIINQLKAAMAGFVIDPPGRVGIVAGYWRPATLPAFDENTLTSGLSVTTKTPMSENCNRVKGLYVSPQNEWQATDYPPVKNDFYLAEDAGREMWRELSYTFVTSHTQSQRLAKIAIEESRQGITVTGSGNFAWFQVRAGDVIKFNNTRRGWTEKEFVVEKIGIDTTSGTIVFPFTLRETAEGVFDWNNGEETSVDLAPNTNLPSPFDVPPPTGLTVLSDSTTREYDAVTDQYIQRMLVSWTAPASAFVTNGGTIRLQFKRTSDSSWREWAPLAGYITQDYVFPIVTDVAYVVRVRSENRLGTPSQWVYSGPTTNSGDTTPPAAPTGFTASAGVNGVALAWTNPADSDLAFIDVYESATNTPAPSGGSTPLVSIGDEGGDGIVDSAWFRSGLGGGVTRFYWIRAVDTSGNRSAWVGPQGATSSVEMTVGASATYLYAVGDVTPVVTPSVTAIVTGGVGPFSYIWEHVSGEPEAAFVIEPTAYTSITCAWNTWPGSLAIISTWRCKVTDFAGLVAYSPNVAIETELDAG